MLNNAREQSAGVIRNAMNMNMRTIMCSRRHDGPNNSEDEDTHTHVVVHRANIPYMKLHEHIPVVIVGMFTQSCLVIYGIGSQLYDTYST